MDYLKQLLLLALCCYNLQTSDSKNVYTFEVDQPKACGSVANNINVNTSSSRHEIDARFLSVALGIQRSVVNYGGSQKLINMASALSPAEIRLGGTWANFMTYVPAASSSQAPNNCDIDDDMDGYTGEDLSFSLTASQWFTFNSFVKKVGWDLLFDVNNFKKTSNGTWDTTNFEQLLNDSAKQGINISHFQLGNEPSAYNSNFGVNIPYDTLVANFRTLKQVISKYPLYASSKICGPDVSNIGRYNSAKVYLEGYIHYGALDFIDEICLHQYYMEGKTATLNDFVSASLMDRLKTMYDLATELSYGKKPVQLSETSSTWGGGTAGLSDAYVAGFLWLDKLGLSAKMKATRVYRQSLVGASYALMTTKYDPYPDYFLSLLYKTLVEGPVFDITLATRNDNIRLYANCASRKRYSAGALVVYYLNLADIDAVLSLAQFPDADLEVYFLTPDEEGLTSKFVKLNGVKLVMTGDQLPLLTPQEHKGDVTVQAKTFGFIVVPGANVQYCMDYYNRLDSNSQDK